MQDTNRDRKNEKPSKAAKFKQKAFMAHDVKQH